MPAVDPYRRSEGGQRFLQFLDEHILVSEEGVGVREPRLHLYRPLEEPEQMSGLHLCRTISRNQFRPCLRIHNTVNFAFISERHRS